VCSRRYPECKAHAFHIVISGLPGSTTFYHITSLMTRFSEKKFTEHKSMLYFLYSFCLKHFSLQEELSEILLKCTSVFMYSTRYSCQILMKLACCWRIFFLNIQLSNLMKTNPVEPELLRADGQTKPKLIIALRTRLQTPFCVPLKEQTFCEKWAKWANSIKKSHRSDKHTVIYARDDGLSFNHSVLSSPAQSLFQSQLIKKCDLLLPLSI